MRDRSKRLRRYAKRRLLELRYFFVASVDRTILFFAPKPTAGVQGKRALIVRLDYIGDYLLWLPAARKMSQKLREEGCAILFVCNPAVASLASSENLFDEVLPLERKKFSRSIFYRWEFLRRITALYYEYAINPTFSREPLFGDSVVRFSRAKNKIGFWGDRANATLLPLKHSSRWFTDLIDTPADSHELEKNELLLRHLFGPEAKPIYGAPQFDLSSLRNFYLPEKFAVLFPGASWDKKKWPLERFGIVGKHLQEKHGLHVVLLGGIDDQLDANRIARCLDPARTVNYAGQTSFEEMTHLLQQAKLVVSNDTSAVHAAAACKVPCVAILGGGHFGRFLPYPLRLADDLLLPLAAYSKMACYSCSWNCVKPFQDGAVACVAQISTNRVVKMVDMALSSDFAAAQESMQREQLEARGSGKRDYGSALFASFLPSRRAQLAEGSDSLSAPKP